MFVEILAFKEAPWRFESTILNFNNLDSITLRKSHASNFLNPDCFPAINYNHDGYNYYELFQSDDLALNRYNEIKKALETNEYNILPMDASHENEPFRNYLLTFGGPFCKDLEQVIQDYNQKNRKENKQKLPTISEWLNNFIDARKKAREAEQTKEEKNLL